MAGEKSYKLQCTIDGSVITASGVITPKQGIKGPTGSQGPTRITPPQGIQLYTEESPLTAQTIWTTGGSGYSDISIYEADGEIRFGSSNTINLTGDKGDKGSTGNSGSQGIKAASTTLGFQGTTHEANVSHLLPVGGLVFNNSGDGTISYIYPAGPTGIVLSSSPKISCIGPTGSAAPTPSKIEVVAVD